MTFPRCRLSSPDTDKELLQRCVFAREHIHIKAAWIILLQTTCCIFWPTFLSHLQLLFFPSMSPRTGGHHPSLPRSLTLLQHPQLEGSWEMVRGRSASTSLSVTSLQTQTDVVHQPQT